MPGSTMSDDVLPNLNSSNPNANVNLPHQLSRQDLVDVDQQIKYLDGLIDQLRREKENSDSLLHDARDRIIELEAFCRVSKSFSDSAATRSAAAKMNPPPIFDGNREDVIPFISKCYLNFQAYPSSFSDERLKILFAASRLDGPPYAWFHPINERYNDPTQPNPPEAETFVAFAAKLRAIYGDPNLHENAERTLRSLRQTTTVAAYIQEFEKNRQYVEWNDRALRSNFYEGLFDNVKGHMIAGGVPDNLLALQDLATVIAARIEGHRHSKLQNSTQARPPGRTPDSKPTPAPQRPAWFLPSLSANRPPSTPITPSPLNSTPRANFPSHTADGTVPMELGSRGGRRGPLTDQEKQYRRANNLCGYCGGKGHSVFECPKGRPAGLRPWDSSLQTSSFNIDVTGSSPGTIDQSLYSPSENDHPQG